MPTLFPPEYPDRPGAPLLSFGPSFSEEIARSVIAAIWFENIDDPQETSVRIAASLTMLEGFHPRDHLECMLAAQGVAAHFMIMDCYRRIMTPGMPEAMAIKIRGNIAQLSRGFSTLLRDLERRQAKPLQPRPPPAGGLPYETPPNPGSATPDPVNPPKVPRGGRKPAASRDAGNPGAERAIDRTADVAADKADPTSATAALIDLENLAEVPEDIETRPDGTPGSLVAYAPRPPLPEPFVSGVPPIMEALATRPKPWRMVNAPSDQPPANATASVPSDVLRVPPSGRGPVDNREAIFGGDALARFASARFDPDAPITPPNFEDEYSEVDLELISAGGDQEAEAHRQEMMEANPEGKPIKTIRYGHGKEPGKPPEK
jgi:hypothetical protein